MGASAAILGLFGCCTASIKDKCSVCLYTSCTTILGLLFAIAAIIAMVIQSQGDSFVATYCDKKYNTTTTDDNILQQASTFLTGKLFDMTRNQIEEIDKSLTQGLDKYMCKKDCPCDPLYNEYEHLWSKPQ